MAIKATIASGSLTPEMLETSLAEALVSAARHIKSLSLESIDDEVVLLACLLVNALSQKDPDEARDLAEYLADILAPKSPIFFRADSKSELSKTNLSKERWGLDPSLIKIKH